MASENDKNHRVRVAQYLRMSTDHQQYSLHNQSEYIKDYAEKNNMEIAYTYDVNRPGFPGECFICELRLPDHRFRWKHNKLFLLLPEEYGPAFPAIVDCYTSPPT